MSYPWIPPSFGAWEDFINSLLHNPFLGSGGGRPPSTHPPLLLRAEPSPSPWSPAVAILMSALSVRQVAATGQGPLKGAVERSVDQAITRFLDDICPPQPRFPIPRHWPWPWPGPWPPPPGPGPDPGPESWIIGLVTTLSSVAATLPAGQLREDLGQVVGQIVNRSFLPDGG